MKWNDEPAVFPLCFLQLCWFRGEQHPLRTKTLIHESPSTRRARAKSRPAYNDQFISGSNAFNWQWRGSRVGKDQSMGKVFGAGARLTNGKATPAGFEPARGDPIGLAGRRLNHSAKVSNAKQFIKISMQKYVFHLNNFRNDCEMSETHNSLPHQHNVSWKHVCFDKFWSLQDIPRE